MRVAVTGAAGFLGSHLSRHLVAQGHDVVGVDDFSRGKRSRIEDIEGLLVVAESIMDRVLVQKLLEGCEVVYHLAAAEGPSRYDKPEQVVKINIEGTRQIIKGARRAGVKKLVLASSSEVYGIDPPVPTPEESLSHFGPPSQTLRYTSGATKYINEIQVASSGVPTTILRFYDVYGPGQQGTGDEEIVGYLIRQVIAGERPNLFGNPTRSFCYIEDAIRALMAAGDPSMPTGTYNIGGSGEVALSDVLDQIQEVAGTYLEPILGDLPPGMSMRQCPALTKATARLGWSPTIGLTEGLKSTIPYYREKVK